MLGYLFNPRSTVHTWYPALRKPALNPPNWIFPPAWTALYITMGYSSHLVARVAMETLSEPKYLVARSALGIYAAQLGVNLLWTPLFFGTRNPRAGLLDIGLLGGLVASMSWLFTEVDEVAGWLCVPYLAWVGFASYLNYSIVKLNPGDGVDKTK
jgi:translocator protein